MKKWLKSNTTSARLTRTIFQGFIGILISNIDVFIEPLTIPPQYKPIIAAAVMAILSPIMSELGGEGEY